MISISNLSVIFGHPDAGVGVQALDRVSLEVREGEFLVIIGPSGCGKTTLLNCVAGLVTPTSGEVIMDGKRVEGPGPDRAVVFQEYALFPWRTVWDNIQFGLELACARKSCPKDEARSRIADAIRLVGLEGFERHLPFQLSGGMRQRVMIAIALACHPRLLIADEATTSLDVTTQAQILKLVKDLRSRVNAAILYITHDLAVIAEISDRVAVMYAGKIVEDAPVNELFAHPMHPYAQGLLESIVSMDSRRVEPGKVLPTIPGTVPDLRNPPSGCRFHPRCKFAWERCRVEVPQLVTRAPQHKVACHLYDPKEAGQHELQR